MPTSLSWVDHSAVERERMRKVLSLIHEKGTVVALGLAVVRDRFATRFFSGINNYQYAA